MIYAKTNTIDPYKMAGRFPTSSNRPPKICVGIVRTRRSTISLESQMLHEPELMAFNPQKYRISEVGSIATFLQFWRDVNNDDELCSIPQKWTSFATESERAILDELTLRNRGQVAYRLNELIEMFVSDPEVDSLDTSSFSSLAGFLMENDLPMPDIGAEYDGTLGVEWRLPLTPQDGDEGNRGILCMSFLSTGKIEYFGSVRSPKGEEVLRWGDTSSHETTIKDVHLFFENSSDLNAIRG